MNAFLAALWAETLKARRSLITPLTITGILLLPLAGGLFMLILKNPAQAKALGIINAKAQLTVGVADWPSYFNMLLQGMTMGGAILYTIITAWIFGREFSDHTAKELMAIPTSRQAIVVAKFALVELWAMGLALLVVVTGLGVGAAVSIPGWTVELGWRSIGAILLVAFFTSLLAPFAALVASWGHGYLPPIGWAIFTLVLANLLMVMGWGDWFPWSIPAVIGGMAKSQVAGLHSYLIIVLACAVGVFATLEWWQKADQAR